ncbi:MAG TPA: sulfite reductase flavoprotein subunit alpha [Herbaspirillum sp.]|jgi:sulfite reductase (NADPH) flavoprotein alpha-component
MGVFKKILFQIHWFVGITAGTLLMMVGVTGAMLAFSEEIIEALNPGVLQIARQDAPKLDMPQLVAKVQADYPDRRIAALVFTPDPADAVHAHPVRVMFAAPPGLKRGDVRYADPYNAQLLPALRAEPFFKTVEFLHRFLLLPTDTGKTIMGSTALCLLFLALSGLYMRWPRHALQWRAWFRLDFSLQGRSFLWHIHSIIGTWVLIMYVISASTGAYMSLEWFKKGVDSMLGGQTQAQPKPPAPKKSPAAKPKTVTREPIAPERAARIWQAFTDAAPAYRRVLFRFPDRADDAVQVLFLDSDAPHEQAQSQMRISPETGAVSQRRDYRDKNLAGRYQTANYSLHMGSYFGLPGRIVMTIGALCLPLFGITGWMLYLDRRRKKRAVAKARDGLNAGPSPAATGTAQEKILLVFASQSGYAERIALNTATALQAAGLQVDLRSIGRTGLDQLRHYHRVLFVASTFGDGEPPDSARGFTRQLMHHPASLAHLRYGVLALGDRHYSHFCGYGHTLDYHLQAQGAQPEFALIEVDNADPAALALWQHALADCYDVADLRMPDAGLTTPAAPAPYHRWPLAERRHLNPGSAGEPIFHLALTPHAGAQWQSGALVEILPRHAPGQIAAFLQQHGLDGAARVQFHGAQCTLAEALARAVLPGPAAAQAAPQALADTLKLLAPRRYSVASITSIAADGSLQLLVRQSTHEGGLGLASGWLTAHAALGDAIEGRLLDNPGFALSEQDVPGIFIGNGSGMAGLRSHLKARVRDGRRRNWLLFGERNRAHDALYADEIAQWRQDGFLQRVDLVFSRDQAERIYVQDKLRAAGPQLREWLADGAVIYVCGSMEGMAAGVDAVLNDLLGEDALEELIAANRYRRDIY